ncbi:GNAT family N-acetyltransferase [Nioella aestuarii]|uniref:GNAT family N-acetyltransferase n=1 Tax=Nioella aestuarii TaxID=1662864 RepID=UPI003D7FF38D
MTPAELARIHAACFTTPRPWSEAELASFLSDPLCDLIEHDGGFGLIRTIAGEAELLTIAVDPVLRRQGRGKAILLRALDRARAKGAEQLFLEVASDNLPAILLYETTGFTQTGLRRNYYRLPNGTRRDAVLMGRNLQASGS